MQDADLRRLLRKLTKVPPHYVRESSIGVKDSKVRRESREGFDIFSFSKKILKICGHLRPISGRVHVKSVLPTYWLKIVFVFSFLRWNQQEKDKYVSTDLPFSTAL